MFVAFSLPKQNTYIRYFICIRCFHEAEKLKLSLRTMRMFREFLIYKENSLYCDVAQIPDNVLAIYFLSLRKPLVLILKLANSSLWQATSDSCYHKLRQTYIPFCLEANPDGGEGIQDSRNLWRPCRNRVWQNARVYSLLPDWLGLKKITYLNVSQISLKR